MGSSLKRKEPIGRYQLVHSPSPIMLCRHKKHGCSMSSWALRRAQKSDLIRRTSSSNSSMSSPLTEIGEDNLPSFLARACSSRSAKESNSLRVISPALYARRIWRNSRDVLKTSALLSCFSRTMRESSQLDLTAVKKLATTIIG